MKPKVTIISVIYNTVDSIQNTIDSVVACRKERPDVRLEYIIIDGASTDGTVEILRKNNMEITKWISEKDNGIYDAMNKGLAMVDDGYILYLGAGDKILSLPTLDLLISNTQAFCGDVVVNEEFVFKSNVARGLRFGNSLHHQGLLIHKSILPDQAFNTKYKAYADYDLNIRLFKSGVNFRYSSYLSGYQMPGGITKKIYIPEMIDVVRENFGIVSAIRLMLYFLFAQTRQLLTTNQNDFMWGVHKQI
jgi:glycosyltransferase involved in cell wall biosynthesis